MKNMVTPARKKFKMKLYLLKRLLLDLLYPNRCPFCNTIIPFDEYYCTECSDKLSLPPEHEIYPYIDCFAAATSYDSVSIPLVGEMKRKGNGYALSAAAFCIFDKLASVEEMEKIDIITFVPMRKKDIYKRGYNQSYEMAKELSGLAGAPCRTLLVKTKNTLEQKNLGEADRRKNLNNAFKFRGRMDLKGKTILVVDDVCTTGSTLSEAARTLKTAGADKIIAAVFAKTVKNT